MKHITAIIQPQKLSEVRESLHAIGIDSLIVEDGESANGCLRMGGGVAGRLGNFPSMDLDGTGE